MNSSIKKNIYIYILTKKKKRIRSKRKRIASGILGTDQVIEVGEENRRGRRVRWIII